MDGVRLGLAVLGPCLGHGRFHRAHQTIESFAGDAADPQAIEVHIGCQVCP